MIRDEEAAKDIILEAFTKANTSLDSFNADTAVFSTWLFAMTKNLFIDNLRKKSLDTTSISDIESYDTETHTVEFNIECPNKNPEGVMILEERNKKVFAIINAMNKPNLKELVIMKYFDELSYDEIAEKTGKPLGTVKALLFRAKELLKDDFEKAGIGL
jgi:RNA polymerase sigma factor, sigma-70 family